MASRGWRPSRCSGPRGVAGRVLFRHADDVREAAIRLTKVSAIFWGGDGLHRGRGGGCRARRGGAFDDERRDHSRQLLLVLLLAGECFLPAREINEAMHLAVWGMSKCERAFSVLETTRPVAAPPDPAPADTASAATGFDDVTFRYRPGRSARGRRA